MQTGPSTSSGVQMPSLTNDTRVPISIGSPIPNFRFCSKQTMEPSANVLAKEVIHVPENKENPTLKKKMRQIEVTLRTIKGVGSYGSVNYSDLCIFSRAQYPFKFQVSDFEKCNGSRDLYTHLKVYIGELGSYAEDESLRMQLFQKV